MSDDKLTFKEKYELSIDWKDRIWIVELYHLKQKIADKHHRLIDTANYFNRSKAWASENMYLAKHMDEIRYCKSRDEALMVLHGHFRDGKIE